jgi:hypothetical protein
MGRPLGRQRLLQRGLIQQVGRDRRHFALPVRAASEAEHLSSGSDQRLLQRASGDSGHADDEGGVHKQSFLEGRAVEGPLKAKPYGAKLPRLRRNASEMGRFATAAAR